MRIVISVLSLCAVAAASPAREEVKRDFQKTAALPAGRSLRVEHSLGSVTIRTQPKNEVAVQGAIRCSADNVETARRFCDQIQIRVEENGAGVNIRTEYPRNETRNLSFSANLEIQIPETAPLDLRNRFGHVAVHKLRAPASINNSNGNVLFMQTAGRQRIENSFGNVEVITNDGDLTIVNGNGWVRASEITGAAEITNRFGEIRASTIGKTLIVHGGNSKVDIEHVNGIANISNTFGDVRVWDAKADLTVHNQNGRVDASTVAGIADLQTSFASIKFTGIGKSVRVMAENSAVNGDTVGESATVQTTFANVDLRGVKGGARISAANSGIRLVGVGGEVYTKTTFAGTTIDDVAGPVTVESANGSVTVAQRPGQACKPVSIQTTFAPIRVTVPAGVGYTVTGKTSFGRIHSEPEMSISGAIAPESITGRIAGGGCDLRLTNQNGNIDIIKR